MNSVATGIRWTPGDRVLTTDQEHDGGSLGWRHVARRHGVAIDRIDDRDRPITIPGASSIASPRR